MTNFKIFSPLIFSMGILSIYCNSGEPRQRAEAKYLNEIQTWQQQRIESLKSPTGWLNLAGLFWLKYGVRLRDHEHPLLKQFAGIETFPVDSTWRLAAKFEANDPPKMIAVPAILNTIIRRALLRRMPPVRCRRNKTRCRFVLQRVKKTI